MGQFIEYDCNVLTSMYHYYYLLIISRSYSWVISETVDRIARDHFTIIFLMKRNSRLDCDINHENIESHCIFRRQFKSADEQALMDLLHPRERLKSLD